MSNFDEKLLGLRIADPVADWTGLKTSLDHNRIRDLENSINLAIGTANLDLAKFAGIPDYQRDLLQGSMGATANAFKQIANLKDQVALAGGAGLAKLASGAAGLDLAKLAGVPDYQLDLSDMQESIASAFKGIDSFKDEMNLAGVDVGLSGLAQQIADQQNAIASLRPLIPEMPQLAVNKRAAFPDLHMPEIRLPPNPLHETNERLASIENRFNRMETIALNGAEIATSLQASAATFLAKFEKASGDNDRTSRRVVWLALVAIVIAVAMPVAQVLYTELWRAPADSASMQAAITDMKSEIKGLQDTQKMASDELAKVLSSGNADMTNALRDIRKLLVKRQ